MGWRALQHASTATHTTSSSRACLHLVSNMGLQQPGAHAILRGLQHELRVYRSFAAQAAAAGGAKGSGKKSPITFNSMLLGVGAFLAVVAVAQNKAQEKVEGMMQRSQEVVGKAAVGGPFTLTDQDGKRFTQDNLKGKFNILYFGFTHCPDICPDELEKLAVALDLIEKQQNYQVGNYSTADCCKCAAAGGGGVGACWWARGQMPT